MKENCSHITLNPIGRYLKIKVKETKKKKQKQTVRFSVYFILFSHAIIILLTKMEIYVLDKIVLHLDKLFFFFRSHNLLHSSCDTFLLE